MPLTYTDIAFYSWLLLLLVWLPGYVTAKKNVRVERTAAQVIATILIMLAITFIFSNAGTPPPPHLIQLTPKTLPLGVIGLLIDLCGIAFAIWARIILGRNWSGMIAVKENPALVQRGPYALVRHPIYTGMAFALFGTALLIGTLTAYLGFICGVTAFIIRTYNEDAIMAQQFPSEHPGYRARTKRLIPFIW